MEQSDGDANMISIHAPRVGSDMGACHTCRPASNFNPRSPRGERLRVLRDIHLYPEFQSTLPAWGATEDIGETADEIEFQSTLPAWGATHVFGFAGLTVDISIHAPRVGSDRRLERPKRRVSPISIHAPRVGSDSATRTRRGANTRFQSTLPAWGATPHREQRQAGR